MADNAIEKLYNEMTDNIYAAINPDGEEKKNKQADASNKCIADTIGKDKFLEIDDFINDRVFASEECGFVTGFKYAMRLMLACGGNMPVSSGETNS